MTLLSRGQEESPEAWLENQSCTPAALRSLLRKGKTNPMELVRANSAGDRQSQQPLPAAGGIGGATGQPSQDAW